MYLFDKKLKANLPNYIFQSVLATLALIVVLLFLNILTQAAIIASLGASAFIVFMMPRSVTAKMRNVIGGHIIGTLIGLGCFLLFRIDCLEEYFKGFLFLRIFVYAFAVGLTIFLMVATDTEHPPAGGTALGFVISKEIDETVLFVVVSVIILALIGRILKPWLKDLV